MKFYPNNIFQIYTDLWSQCLGNSLSDKNEKLMLTWFKKLRKSNKLTFIFTIIIFLTSELNELFKNPMIYFLVYNNFMFSYGQKMAQISNLFTLLIFWN